MQRVYIKFTDGDLVATDGDRLKRSLAHYLLYKGEEEIGRFPVHSVAGYWTEDEPEKKPPMGYL